MERRRGDLSRFIGDEGDFVSIPRPTTPFLVDVDSEQSAPIERTDRNDVLATIREVFADGVARSREEAIAAVAEAMGYRHLGNRIRDTLDDDIRTAVRRKILQNRRDRLSLATRVIDDYSRDELIDAMLTDMTGWWDRADLTRATARHLGFRRTGSRIRKALKSAINGAIRRGMLESEGAWVRKA